MGSKPFKLCWVFSDNKVDVNKTSLNLAEELLNSCSTISDCYFAIMLNFFYYSPKLHSFFILHSFHSLCHLNGFVIKAFV